MFFTRMLASTKEKGQSLIFKACYALIVHSGTLYIVPELFHSPLEDSLVFKQQLPLYRTVNVLNRSGLWNR